MGKRRIRCIQTIGGHEIVGFDTRADRRDEAKERYGIEIVHTIEDGWMHEPDVVVISVPPDLHEIYMKATIARNIHFFVEASVIDNDLLSIHQAVVERSLVGVPSCTMLFHSGITVIRDQIRSGNIGKVSNFSFHSGQYLPDWHISEPVSGYYVSNPLTGGGREIVPFELTWLIKVFGLPKRVSGTFGRTINIPGAEYIDDTYSVILDYGTFSGTLVVDVSSRFATRRLLVNGDKAQLRWEWERHQVEHFDPAVGTWRTVVYDSGSAAEGYNQNIGESMYVREIEAFIAAIEKMAPYPTDMHYDIQILALLRKIEESSLTGRWIAI